MKIFFKAQQIRDGLNDFTVTDIFKKAIIERYLSDLQLLDEEVAMTYLYPNKMEMHPY